MLFVSVWTGLRVSELIGLKWRCIHAGLDLRRRALLSAAIGLLQKRVSSAATIGVAPEVIARILRLKSLTVEVRAGCTMSKHKLVKSNRNRTIWFFRASSKASR